MLLWLISKELFMRENYTKFTNNTITIAKQSGIFIIGNFIEVLLRGLYCWILAKSLGAEGVGTYFLAFMIVNFILLISRAELQEGVLRFVASFKGVGNKSKVKATVFSAIKLVIIFSIIVCSVMFFASNFIATNIFKQPLLSTLIRLLLISLPIMGIFSIFLAYFQAHLKMKYYALTLNILQPLGNIVFFLLFFVLGLQIFGAVYAYICSLILALLTAIYFLKKSFDLFEKDSLPSQHTKELLNFSLPLSLVAILNFFMQWIGVAILGYFRSAHEVGIYTIVVKTATFSTVFLVAFNSTFAPMIADFYNKKMIPSLEALFKVVTKWTLILSLPILVVLIVFSKDVLGIFGEGFSTGANALIILTIGRFFDVGVGATYYIILMSGRSKLALINSIIVCVVNFILSLIFISKFGLLGGAIAYTISLAMFSVITLIEVYIFLGIHPYSLKFTKPLVAAAISVVFFYACRIFVTILGLNVYPIFFILVSVFCYALVLHRLKFDKEDKVILNFLRRKISFIG